MPTDTRPAHDDVRFYAHRFVQSRYRGRAHLDHDLSRFASTYRIPPEQRRDVRRAVLASLAGAR